MSMTMTHGAIVRQRVRTPGKHIVAFIAGAAIVIAGATSILQSTGFQGAVFPAAQEQNPLAPVRAGGAVHVPFEEFLVDLSPDSAGRTAYLKMSVTLAARENAAAQAVDAARPAINERLTFFLRALQPEDFQGSDGMARVKTEMRRRVNLVIAPHAIDEVMIGAMVIQ